MKEIFSLGIWSTQLSESLNKDLKNYLKSNMDIVRFFKHFERVVADKREKETISEYDCRKKQLRVKVNVPILLQMSQRYTPKIFELFQLEYELSMAAQIQVLMENEYIVTICDVGNIGQGVSKCCRVVWNASDDHVSCSCKKFEQWGILCCHALKLLDTMNIKILPEKYVLKRWTREARNCVARDRNGVPIVDTKLDITRRNRNLCRKFTNIAAKASSSEERYTFVDGILNKLEKDLDEKEVNPLNTPPSMDNLTQESIRLKKKEGKKGGKRHKS